MDFSKGEREGGGGRGGLGRGDSPRVREDGEMWVDKSMAGGISFNYYTLLYVTN